MGVTILVGINRTPSNHKVKYFKKINLKILMT